MPRTRLPSPPFHSWRVCHECMLDLCAQHHPRQASVRAFSRRPPAAQPDPQEEALGFLQCPDLGSFPSTCSNACPSSSPQVVGTKCPMLSPSCGSRCWIKKKISRNVVTSQGCVCVRRLCVKSISLGTSYKCKAAVCQESRTPYACLSRASHELHNRPTARGQEGASRGRCSQGGMLRKG